MRACKEYFPSLDGFRFLAVVLVLMHHMRLLIPMHFDRSSFFWTVFEHASIKGFLGVDFFFVISGFLITGLLLEDLGGRIRLKRFYLRRAYKILPQYFAVVIAGVVITLYFAPHKYAWSSYASYFVMLPNYSKPLGILAHLWSVAVEEHFYIFLPLLFWFVSRMTAEARNRKILLGFMFLFFDPVGQLGAL